MPCTRVTHKARTAVLCALAALLVAICAHVATAIAGPPPQAGAEWDGWSGLAPAALLSAGSAPGPAAGPVVDGISDQNLASWLWTSFAARVFPTGPEGGTSPRIRFARYVVPWQAGASPENSYRSEFYAWREAALAAHLATDVAIGTYTGAVPGARQYRVVLSSLLAGHGVSYLEAWNEPNHVPRLRSQAGLAPEYMREAAAYCSGAGCTPVAGDFLDEPGSASYALGYRTRLAALGVGSSIWGIHPYEDVNGVNAGSPDPEAEADAIASQLVPGQQLWITEAGAYYCFGRRFRWSAQVAESLQRAAAERLVSSVAPRLGAAHVFYYGLFAGRGRSLCPTEDTELYDGSEALRPAGAVILGEPGR